MDAEYWRRVEHVLDVALESDPSQWPALVAEQCEGDDSVRREVESLLGRYATARSYLTSRPVDIAAALLAEARETGVSYEGRRFGAYRVVRELGRGGMSRVFLAERADGEFEQQVALKLLRPGLDSDIDQSRFKVERQILASLNHPNIARLLDGGVTPEGVPFLLMELVDGEPIDQYCDARQLGVVQRLRLFLEMAAAVQSAHRSLIVHRDLKPSNIFVTRDGVVKLLDFGLAKLLEPEDASAAAQATVSTHRWMTPEYAAPEQILSGPITTSTDVYQLGVVLYRLLTGRTPFGGRDRTTSVHELERAILEAEPPPLDGELRGDLDAILRKALAKEPNARYASVQQLSDDIQRYLDRRPVLARRQTTSYRLQRFARRHRASVVAAAAVVALLGVYVGTVLADRARIRLALVEAQAGTRKAEQVTDFMLGLFEAAEGGQSLHDTVTAHLLLNRALDRANELAGQPELKAQMLDVIGRIHTQLGDIEKAKPLLTEALAIRRSLHGERHPEVATSYEALANVSAATRDKAETVRLRRRVLEIRRAIAGNDDAKSLDALYDLARSIHGAGDRAAAAPLFAEWLNAVAHQPRQVTELRASQLIAAGELLSSRGDLDRADSVFREGLAIRQSLYGDRHSLIAAILVQLAQNADLRRAFASSDSLYRSAEAMQRSVYPQGHPSLGTTLNLHGNSLQRANRFADAEPLLRESRALAERFEGPNSLSVAQSDINLGFSLTMIGKYTEAEAFDRDAVRILRSMFDDKNAMVVMARDHLGDALRGQGRYAEAEPLLLAGYERFKVPNFVTKVWLGHVLTALVRLYEAEGRPEEAAKYRAIFEAGQRGPAPSQAGARSTHQPP